MFDKLRDVQKTHVQLVVVTLIAVFAFLWRLVNVLALKPIMLQDEWIYAYGSLEIGLWEKTEFDYGNPLFNFIFSSNSVCQDAFYTCGKLMNLGFTAGFSIVASMLALTLGVTKLLSAGTGIAVFLSPVGAYSSMYLPEPLYFFMLALAMFFVAKAITSENSKTLSRDWILAGAALGLAALTKPHALLFLPAFGVAILVFALGGKWNLRRTLATALSFGASFLIVRLLFGVLLGGPKTLDILGSYGAATSIQRVFTSGANVQTTPGADSGFEYLGAGPVNGAFGLFWGEFGDHLAALIALSGLALVLVLVGAASNFSHSNVSPASQFALFIFIAVIAIIISISLFEGWITGSGDDHTARILMRYYDFMIPLVYVAGLAVLYSHFTRQPIANFYWIGAGLLATVVSILGVQQNHQSLTIQIADAPFMAGFVTDQLLNGFIVIALLAGSFSLILLRSSRLAMALAILTLFPLVWMGQGSNLQYQFARSGLSSGDRAGQFLATNFSGLDDNDLRIISTSRFDARTASFWSLSNSEIDLVPAGSFVNTADMEAVKWALVIGDVNLFGDQIQYGFAGSGFTLFRLDKNLVSGFSPSTYNSSFISGTEGLSGNQDWGSWVVGQVARVRTLADIAQGDSLNFKFLAAPGSAGEVFTIRLGDREQDYQIPASGGYFDVSFPLIDIRQEVYQVEILTPSPRSGLELGINGDSNPIGIGLAEMVLIRDQ